MTRQGNWSRLHHVQWSVKTGDPSFLSCHFLFLQIIRKSRRSIGPMKYIPTCVNLVFLGGVSLILLFLGQRSTSANSSNAVMIIWPLTLASSAVYHCQSGVLHARSFIWVTQQSIKRYHCLGPADSSLLMTMDWAISEPGTLTWLSFRCVVKPPFSYHIPMASAAHWLTPTPAFSAWMRTRTVSIWIVVASGTTDFGNQKVSHYTLGSQRWSMIEWWISNAHYYKQATGVLNILPGGTRCGSRGEEGVSKVLENVGNVGRQGKYIYGIGGISLIRRHHLRHYSARKEFA